MLPEQLFADAEERLRLKHIAEALQLYTAAEKASYDADACAAGRWTCHMLAGDFELAWCEGDAISARSRPDPNRFWDGRPVTGRKVLLRCLHGLGDTIQFIRYAGLVQERAQSFAVEAQPRLKALLHASRVAEHVFAWGEPEPDWNQQIEIVELPRIFRTTVGSIPDHVPYLEVPHVSTVAPNDGSSTLRVGVVWASSNYFPGRSIPFEIFEQLFAIPGVDFFSLQGGIESAQLAPWSNRIVQLDDESTCLLETAKALKSLHLVISVDTMIAHLAGALARPVWTLLPYESDWRWMLEREDSPWYPTMRLFRQPRPGDWKTVIERVQDALQAISSNTSIDRASDNYEVKGETR